MRLRTYWRKQDRYIYPPSTEQPLTERPPASPAAAMLYDADGHCWVLALDFDAKVHGAAAVTADAADAYAFFTSLGARVVTDVAASGGRHVWVPLAAASTADEIRQLMDLFKLHWRTLDISCATNQAGGCLTVPGSLGKDGDHRQLTVPLDEAVDAVTRRNPTQLLAAVAAAITTLTQHLIPEPVPDRLPDPACDAGPSGLASEALQIAVDGTWPEHRRTAQGALWSRSEACFSVLNAAIGHHLSFEDVEDRMLSGEWAGLMTLYTGRYGHRWHSRLRAEWRKVAATHGRRRPPRRASTPATQETPPTGGAPSPTAKTSDREAEREFIHHWLTVAEAEVARQFPGADGHTAIAVVHGIAALAWRTGSRRIDLGVRSYAHATGGSVEYTTAALVLRKLRETPVHQQLIRRDARSTGRTGDRLELQLPTGTPAPVVPRTGVLRPVPAVFGVQGPNDTGKLLGPAGWRLYLALRRGATGTAPRVAETAGVGRSTTYKLLPVLASLHLASQTGTGEWSIGPADPRTAGCTTTNREHLQRLHARHRADRQAWRDRLQRHLDRRQQSRADNPPPSAPPEHEQPTPLPREPLRWHPDDLREPPETPDACDTVDPLAAAVALLADVLDARVRTVTPAGTTGQAQPDPATPGEPQPGAAAPTTGLPDHPSAWRQARCDQLSAHIDAAYDRGDIPEALDLVEHGRHVDPDYQITTPDAPPFSWDQLRDLIHDLTGHRYVTIYPATTDAGRPNRNERTAMLAA
jgi:hypothetical protein